MLFTQVLADLKIQKQKPDRDGARASVPGAALTEMRDAATEFATNVMTRNS
ncbi:hypothetical protein [Amycolatopsis aidingensis]|uniref:hypothetical protein n=1 Tax=Amycolatopsis aidingensis TaxID=2842453 RepID=UPI001C0D087D|nr:hypothetical protein [Amycolatopsis aidingensis]